MSIIGFARTKQSLKRVITRNEETSKIYEKLPSNVEENEEKVNGDKTEEGIDFRDRGLLLEVVERRVLGKLPQTS